MPSGGIFISWLIEHARRKVGRETGSAIRNASPLHREERGGFGGFDGHVVATGEAPVPGMILGIHAYTSSIRRLLLPQEVYGYSRDCFEELRSDSSGCLVVQLPR